MIIRDAVVEFRRCHGGLSPVEILVSRAAAIVIVAQQSLSSEYENIPVRIVSADELRNLVSEAPGRGTRVALVVTKLPGERDAVVAGECC